jgi:hypothetical protein
MKTIASMTSFALVSAASLALLTSNVEAKSLARGVYDLKVKVVKAFGMDAKVGYSRKLKNGVSVKQQAKFIAGKQVSTTRTFTSAKPGTKTILHNSALVNSSDKYRGLNNGTKAWWGKALFKPTKTKVSGRAMIGTKGGSYLEGKVEGNGFSGKMKQRATPTSFLQQSSAKLQAGGATVQVAKTRFLGVN